ncbi:MAG TPA: TIGR01777 family oxidoreductase, partial [Candidatus Polarisedimenticolaceae bacterium]|nr:TIGR01777 family oxidoreductase [Candidatus Polarisedimenticolaceae bacterium]
CARSECVRWLRRSIVPVPAQVLYAWHLRPGAFERLAPPWERVELLERPARLSEGARVVLRIGGRRWVAEHRRFVDGRGFEDVQLEGPFAAWRHVHRFVPAEAETSWLEDEIDYRLPLDAFAAPLVGRRVERRLRRAFDYRHRVVQGDLERHRAVADRPRLAVGVSGSSGLVGSALSAFLTSGGHRVVPLVRQGAGFAPEGFAGVDAVVHLAGESIARRRWSAAQKERIADSRVQRTRWLAEALARLERPPRALIAASAIGYYGDRGTAPLDEQAAAGSGFLADVCQAWEQASEPAERAGIRVVRLRIGVVLSGRGGALARMLPPFRLGLGGRIGDGRQVMSWIALDDLVGAIHFALYRAELHGAVNATAPEPVTNAEFAATLGRVLRRPAVVPLPAVVVRGLLGEMGQELLLSGAHVVPGRLEAAGFRFLRPGLESALRHELGA